MNRLVRQRGNHLTEIALVGAVLCLLAGIVVPIAEREIRGSDNDRAKSSMNYLADLFLRYQAHTQAWPAPVLLDPESSRTHTGFSPILQFDCFLHNAHRLNGWSGPYVDPAHPHGDRDPWGGPFYVGYAGPDGPLGANGGIYLLSAGPDGEVNTSNEDIAADRAGGDDLLHIVTRRQ